MSLSVTSLRTYIDTVDSVGVSIFLEDCYQKPFTILLEVMINQDFRVVSIVMDYFGPYEFLANREIFASNDVTKKAWDYFAFATYTFEILKNEYTGKRKEIFQLLLQKKAPFYQGLQYLDTMISANDWKRDRLTPLLKDICATTGLSIEEPLLLAYKNDVVLDNIESKKKSGILLAIPNFIKKTFSYNMGCLEEVCAHIELLYEELASWDQKKINDHYLFLSIIIKHAEETAKRYLNKFPESSQKLKERVTLFANKLYAKARELESHDTFSCEEL